VNRTFSRLLAIIIAGASLAACARVPRVASDDEWRVRHARGVAERAARSQAMRADGRVQLDGRATGRLPALIAQATLAGDSGFRLRARWLLGAAADVVLRGDSLVVWVPAERIAFALAGAGETLGVGAPGEWVARVIGATWSPPQQAWRAATTSGESHRVAWREAGDSLALEIDAAGEPSRMTLWREGRGVDVRYEQWRESEGVRWPHRVVLADREGWLSCALTLESTSFPARARSEWLELTLPHDARRIGWDELREWLDLLGVGG